MAQKPYQNEAWLREEYHEKGRTLDEMAEECGVTGTTIGDWMDRYDIDRRNQREAQKPDKPYTNKEWLQAEYHREERSLHDIAEECGVTGAVILKWMRRYDIPRRSQSDSQRKPRAYQQTEYGEVGGLPGGWVTYNAKVIGTTKSDTVKEHQLVAIANGADPHKVFSGGEWHVHHKNGIRWDNRPENLELVPGDEHIREHSKDRERTNTGEWV